MVLGGDDGAVTWDEVGVRHGTDKSSIGHNYLRYYEYALAGHDVRRVLEIGVDTGASLRTWCDIFPDADVIGMDIRPECADADVGRAAVVIGDATFPNDLITGPFDFIVDDGSHQVPDAILSFNAYFPLLKYGGIYAIEDIPMNVPAAPMSSLLAALAQHPDVFAIHCGRSAMSWDPAWPGYVLVTKA